MRTRAPAELAALPGVVEVITDKRELPDLLARFGARQIPEGISRFGDRHRAYIKVQDGCLLRCSYCIIPMVRPQMTSRPLAAIVAETQRLVDNGYREIVLTGIHLGHYGVDGNWQRSKTEWIRLATLLRHLAALDGDFRIRLSSLEATEITRELLQVMAEYPERICPHLHVCLQSGSDRILRRMKRRGGQQRIVDRCRLAQQFLHKPALTTDVIVGFPGETEDDFRQTCRVAEELEFSKIHIFPFSARRGTPAAELPDRVAGTGLCRAGSSAGRTGRTVATALLLHADRRTVTRVAGSSTGQPARLPGRYRLPLCPRRAARELPRARIAEHRNAHAHRRRRLRHRRLMENGVGIHLFHGHCSMLASLAGEAHRRSSRLGSSMGGRCQPTRRH